MNIAQDYLFKNYKSRDDRRVQICTVLGPDKNHPIVVAYQTDGGGWTYDSVTNEGREVGTNLPAQIDSENDLMEVETVTVKQTFVWKGPIDAMKEHLGGEPLAFDHFEDGVSVAEHREVIE